MKIKVHGLDTIDGRLQQICNPFFRFVLGPLPREVFGSFRTGGLGVSIVINHCPVTTGQTASGNLVAIFDY